VVNKEGITYVGLIADGVQQKRTIAHLVAKAFLDPPPNSGFDSVIHLDGDRFNFSADNLMWRPRWFAMRFHRQFLTKAPFGMRPDVPVQEIATGERFQDIWFVVSMFGLIWYEVYTAAWNFTNQSSEWASVWPTGQQFRLLKKSTY
jgi:hypothetical protein